MSESDYPVPADYARIGAVLRAARERKGIQQKDMAAQLGRTKSGLSKIELGKAATSLKLLMAFAEAVDVDLVTLAAPREPEAAGPEARRAGLLTRIARMAHMSEEALDTLTVLVEMWERMAGEQPGGEASRETSAEPEATAPRSAAASISSV